MMARGAEIDLAQCEPFKGLSAPRLAEIAASCRTRSFRGGSVLFHQGDVHARAHVLLEGAIRIAQSGADGGQSVLRFIKPGQIFGSVSLFTTHLYPADAVAVIDGVEASWSETELRDLMKAYPLIAANLLHIVGERLQEAQERFRELATQGVERRLARALLRLADQATPGGEIAFPVRRRDLADLIGASQYTVSRLMSGWDRDGLILARGRRIVLKRPADVTSLAENG